MESLHLSKSLWDSDEECSQKHSYSMKSKVETNTTKQRLSVSAVKLTEDIFLHNDYFPRRKNDNVHPNSQLEYEEAIISSNPPTSNHSSTTTATTTTITIDNTTNQSHIIDGIDYKSLYFQEKSKSIELERKIIKLERQIKELLETSSNLNDNHPSDHSGNNDNDNHTEKIEKDDHWNQLVEREKARKQKLRLQKQSMSSTNTRRHLSVHSSISTSLKPVGSAIDDIDSNTASFNVITTDVSSNTSNRRKEEENQDQNDHNENKNQSKIVDSDVLKNNEKKEKDDDDDDDDVAPTLRSSSTSKTSRSRITKDHLHHRSGGVGTKMSLRRSQTVLRSPINSTIMSSSSISGQRFSELKISNQTNQLIQSKKSSHSTSLSDSFNSSNDNSGGSVSEESDSWDDSDQEKRNITQNLTKQQNKSSTSHPSKTNISAIASSSSSSLRNTKSMKPTVSSSDKDSWSEDDDKDDHGVNQFHSKSVIDKETLEADIEESIRKWAISRRDILHMFTTIHEVYDGLLPQLDQRWQNGTISLIDNTEIRKTYLKLVKYCHPDKNSSLKSTRIKLQAMKVFAALTDYYNVYKTQHEILS